MAFDKLDEFIQFLKKKQELKVIDAKVDPKLEITEIVDRVVKAGGPALLFTNVKGSQIPLAINLFGTRRRMSWALGVEDLDEIGTRFAKMFNLKVPESLLGKVAMMPKLLELAKFPPKVVRKAPCQDVVIGGKDVDLYKFPVTTSWPQDGGPYILFGQVVTKDPETGTRNMGLYRLQVLDKNTTAMHWQRHKGGAAHFRKAKEKGMKRLEVAVVVGSDPATMYATSAPLPESIEEYLFSGFIRKDPVELVKCKTLDLEVPAESEIVLEGYVDTEEDLRLEGPFGDHTGFYSLADYYPAFHVTTVTTRAKPVYVSTIVGQPIMEDDWMGFATERIFLPLAKLVIPELVDYHMPFEGIFHNLVFASIDKQYPGQAFKVMNGLWGLGQMMFAKVIVVVDKDVDVQNTSEAWWYALNNIDPQRDVIFTKGPADVLDHSSQHFSFGTKMGIDGTRKWKDEGITRPWPDKIVMSDEIKKLVDSRWKTFGL
ncbi:MAG TPA: menaquinone biosynthesis decarboxylase [Candidatus Kryptonia bacterium]